MSGGQFAKWWMTVGGILMIVMGAMAVVDTRLVGSRPDAMLTLDSMHGIVHALGGVLSVGIGWLLAGRARANATIAYGALFVLGFALNMASPDLWGMMDVPVNTGVHVMHFTVAVLSLAAGFLARSEAAPYRSTLARSRS